MSHAWLPEEPQPPKEEVDWDAWLGPCPWRPYNSTYVSGGWRGHYDFHTSCIGEWVRTPSPSPRPASTR